MAPFTDGELKEKVHDGYIVESVEEMTEGYRKSLVVQLTVQADTELMSAPAYWMAARHAPSANTQVSAHAIIQDELVRYGEQAYLYLETRPGMTGLWQVSGRNDTDYDKRVNLDAWYARNWSLWYDIVILIKTLPLVINRKGAY